MIRSAVRATTVLFALACGGAPDDQRVASADASRTDTSRGAAPPDSVPCVPDDRMPKLAPDTTREYRLRVVPPDSTREYAGRELRVPPCPSDSVRAP